MPWTRRRHLLPQHRLRLLRQQRLPLQQPRRALGLLRKWFGIVSMIGAVLRWPNKRKSISRLARRWLKRWCSSNKDRISFPTYGPAWASTATCWWKLTKRIRTDAMPIERCCRRSSRPRPPRFVPVPPFRRASERCSHEGLLWAPFVSFGLLFVTGAQFGLEPNLALSHMVAQAGCHVALDTDTQTRILRHRCSCDTVTDTFVSHSR